MRHYHVIIKYKQVEKGGKGDGFFNLSEEKVRRRFAVPYMKNKAILAYGDFVYPREIDEIHVFESEKPHDELILPNGNLLVDELDFEYLLRCLSAGKVKGAAICTDDFIPSPPEEKEEPESKISTWSEYISFLGLDENWLHAVIALQSQEVAVTILSKRLGINLDKHHVEEVLGKEVKGDLTFKMKYDAFSKEVEKLCKVKMPLMTKDLRGMRTQVLHKGYNPKKEETDAIVFFTTGFLQKLESLKPQSM